MSNNSQARDRLGEKIAGEITLSEDPGATFRKWRTDFDISQTALASELDISSSVISDYESGRRDNPGVRIIRRLVQGLLTLDEQRGGERIRQYVRIHSAGFESDVVLDLQEYTTPLALNEFYDLLDATEVQEGKHSHINGHTVINSIEAITSLSSDEFYRLYGRSTSRALVFTDVSRGESPLVALRVVIPTPNAVLLHGINQSELWEFAPLLAQKDGYSLAVTDCELDQMLDLLRDVG